MVAAVMGLLTNEPSLGLYRIAEHVEVKSPRLIDLKTRYEGLDSEIKGTIMDIDYSAETLGNMSGITSFQNINACLDQALIKTYGLTNPTQTPTQTPTPTPTQTPTKALIKPQGHAP